MVRLASAISIETAGGAVIRRMKTTIIAVVVTARSTQATIAVPKACLRSSSHEHRPTTARATRPLARGLRLHLRTGAETEPCYVFGPWRGFGPHPRMGDRP